MSKGMSRREFLAALQGLGAAVVLPTNASRAQVDAEWRRLLDDPWYFEVHAGGMIDEPDGASPEVNADVYDGISVEWIKDPETLIDEVDEYDELRSHFQELYAVHAEEMQSELEAKVADLESKRDAQPKGSAESKALSRQIAKIRKSLAALDPYEEDGWKSWIEEAGLPGLPGFKRAIEDWLKAPVDWSACDSWPEGWSGQGRALSFFRDQDSDTLEALGVVLVEGEHPGSSYYAAELEGSIGDANAAAARLKLPFRFRRIRK